FVLGSFAALRFFERTAFLVLGALALFARFALSQRAAHSFVAAARFFIAHAAWRLRLRRCWLGRGRRGALGADRRRHAGARCGWRGCAGAWPVDRALLAHFDGHLLRAAMAEALTHRPRRGGARQGQRLTAARGFFLFVAVRHAVELPILNSSSVRCPSSFGRRQISVRPSRPWLAPVSAPPSFHDTERQEAGQEAGTMARKPARRAIS